MNVCIYAILKTKTKTKNKDVEKIQKVTFDKIFSM